MRQYILASLPVLAAANPAWYPDFLKATPITSDSSDVSATPASEVPKWSTFPAGVTGPVGWHAHPTGFGGEGPYSHPAGFGGEGHPHPTGFGGEGPAWLRPSGFVSGEAPAWPHPTGVPSGAPESAFTGRPEFAFPSAIPSEVSEWFSHATGMPSEVSEWFKHATETGSETAAAASAEPTFTEQPTWAYPTASIPESAITEHPEWFTRPTGTEGPLAWHTRPTANGVPEWVATESPAWETLVSSSSEVSAATSTSAV